MAHILVVEDEPALAQLARDILEMGGFEVATVTDGLDAMRFVGMVLPEELSSEPDWKFTKNNWNIDPAQPVIPDLILTDCMMPRVDGFTLVTALAQDERLRAVPVIVLTSKAKMEDPFKQLPNVKGFLAKGASPSTILQLVRKTLTPP